MKLGLENKKVFITASTDGIGRACAECFLQEGASVIVNGRNKDKLQKCVTELRKKYGEQCVAGVKGDMSDEIAIHTARRYVEEKYGLLDVLIGNLGTGKPIGGGRWDAEEWNYLLKMNLLSAVKLVNEFQNYIAQQKDASMIFITSLAAFDKIGAPPAYAAAKAGIVSLIKYLSDEMSDKNIRVNGVAPGNIFYQGGRWEELEKKDPAGTKEYIERAVPMKRFGMVEEIASAVVFLASPISSFTTGTVLKVDGGQSRGY